MPATTSAAVLGFADYEPQARQLAQALEINYQRAEVHHFPDGESRVTLPPELPERVVLCRSLDQPDKKLIELMLAAAAARALGVKELNLVAPYLCYMRQDSAFRRGEAVSQRIVGRWLASQFETVITVDPHLHRIAELTQAIPAQRAMALSAAPMMGEFIATNLNNPLLVGPDEESAQWVSAVAGSCGLEYIVARKTRCGDREVEIQLPRDISCRDRCTVLVDDIASTGRTLARAAEQLLQRGATLVHAMVVHPLFVDDAVPHMHTAGVNRIWSTDSIQHPTNVIALAPLLAHGIAS